MSRIFRFNELKGFSDIEDFYKHFTDYLYNDAQQTAIFDLENMTFLTLEAVLALLCASKLWKAVYGARVEWRTSETAKLYLERANILQVFANEIFIKNIPKNLLTRGASLSLMEIREISADPEQNSHDVSNTIATSSSLLLGRISTKQLGGISTLLSEIIQNVTHSQVVGHSFMQTYDIGRKHRVHIGIVDTGLGIESSLSTKYPNLHSASEYIKLALSSGVTSKSQGDGLGLYQVDNIIRRDRGALTIRSGTGMLQVYKGNIYQWDNLANIPGTQVYITMWGQYEQRNWKYLLRDSVK